MYEFVFRNLASKQVIMSRQDSNSSVKHFQPLKPPLRKSSKSPDRRSSRSSTQHVTKSHGSRLPRSPSNKYTTDYLQTSSRNLLRKPSTSPKRRSGRSPQQRQTRSYLERRSRSPPLRRQSRSPPPLQRQSRSPPPLQRRSRSPSWGRLKDPKSCSYTSPPRQLSIRGCTKSDSSDKHDKLTLRNTSTVDHQSEDVKHYDDFAKDSQVALNSVLMKETMNQQNPKQIKIEDCDNESCQSSFPLEDTINKKSPKPMGKQPKILECENDNTGNIVSGPLEKLHEKGECLSLQCESDVPEHETKVVNLLINEKCKAISTSCSDISKPNSSPTELDSCFIALEQAKSSFDIQDISKNETIQKSQPNNLEQTFACFLTSHVHKFDKPVQSSVNISSLTSCESGKQIDNAYILLNEHSDKSDELNYSACNLIDTKDENTINESNLVDIDPDLREFDILDDLNESEHGDNSDDGDVQSNSSECETDNDEVPVEDIDAMLEEGLPDKFKVESNEGDRPITKLRHKVVLEEIGRDHFDLLPEGWIQINHSSGMPVYLHQKSRVCTMTRPYYLGRGSSRNHKVPLSAIPCLQYKRALEKEKTKKEENDVDQTQCHPELKLMSAQIETFEENEAAQSLEISDLHEYCKKVFNFKTITVLPFKSWAQRRKYSRIARDLKRRQRPTLPGGTKLLKFPVSNTEGSNSKAEWIINPNGKSYVCILHEYVQHALRKHPKYKFSELENPATPYSATVYIEDLQYGVGVGASKKQAKVEAAKAALEVLIPEMKEKVEKNNQFGINTGTAKASVDNTDNDISIFDQIKVEDPRVAEFCAKTTEPPPYAILLTCLSRNMGLGELTVHYEMNSKFHKLDEFTMTVGKHKATVVCKNKREGKQRAAQSILQSLHPNITHWGSLLRMYGNRSIKNVKEKKQEEQEITSLQSKASLNQPNYAILNKLRTEMLKLKENREAITAKGKFTLPENIVLPSLSSTDLNKVNLIG